MAERIQQMLTRQVSLEGKDLQIGLAIGVAVNDLGGAKVDDLMRQAGLALRESKAQGDGAPVFFSREMEERHQRIQRLGEEIAESMAEGRFLAWYQPQFDALTHELAGVEALMRWDHPKLGVLEPDKFIPLAEDLRHIATLEDHCMMQAIRDYRAWAEAGLDVPKISLNLSAQRLADPGLLASLERLDVPGSLLSFELLESIYLDETEEPMEWNLDGLRDMGISFEIDDFGTGRTSIVSLVRLRPDRLKIDRQLVQPIVASEPARRLVSSIVEIGNSLDIGVTAEGVETMEHAEILRDLGCTVLQGFAFGRAMPAEELVGFVRARAGRVA